LVVLRYSTMVLRDVFRNSLILSGIRWLRWWNGYLIRWNGFFLRLCWW